MAPWPPTAQAPWSPTAQAFAQHQFSHVTNFWKQGRPASFRLEALPDGNAELSLTFKLPTASEVIPPPFFSSPAPLLKRPIIPLFPEGYAPRYVKPKQAPKLSSRRRKNYRRSVLHKAALAVHTLPPPVVGSLRQAAQACVQRLQAASALPSTPSGYKRPFSDSTSPSPSNLPPSPRRIRKDFQIEESEVESPEKETLRSAPILGNSPTPVSPLVKDFPSPAPLVLTPVPPKMMNCLNCEEEMTPGHQCDSTEMLEESALEGGALEGGALEEGALEEGTLEEGALEEGANVGESDEQVEQVNKSAEVYCCYSCSNLRRRRVLCQRL